MEEYQGAEVRFNLMALVADQRMVLQKQVGGWRLAVGGWWVLGMGTLSGGQCGNKGGRGAGPPTCSVWVVRWRYQPYEALTSNSGVPEPCTFKLHALRMFAVGPVESSAAKPAGVR